LRNFKKSFKASAFFHRPEAAFSRFEVITPVFCLSAPAWAGGEF
jgi:hypothetical protein